MLFGLKFWKGVRGHLFYFRPVENKGLKKKNKIQTFSGMLVQRLRKFPSVHSLPPSGPSLCLPSAGVASGFCVVTARRTGTMTAGTPRLAGSSLN
jgi:hypothetical protein